MARLWRSDERAEGVVLMELTVIAVGVVVAAIVFSNVSRDAEETSAASWTNERAGGVSTLTLESAPAPVEWGGVEVLLGDEPLAYDAALAEPGTYCVVTQGSACLPALDPHARLAEGHRVRVYAPEGAGELTLRAADAAAPLYRGRVG